jgi:hypothetical protein
MGGSASDTPGENFFDTYGSGRTRQLVKEIAPELDSRVVPTHDFLDALGQIFIPIESARFQEIQGRTERVSLLFIHWSQDTSQHHHRNLRQRGRCSYGREHFPAICFGEDNIQEDQVGPWRARVEPLLLEKGQDCLPIMHDMEPIRTFPLLKEGLLQKGYISWVILY